MNVGFLGDLSHALRSFAAFFVKISERFFDNRQLLVILDGRWPIRQLPLGNP